MDSTTREYYIRLNYQAGAAAQTAQADLAGIGRAGTAASEAVAAGLTKADKQAEALGNRLQAVQDRITLTASKLSALQAGINQIVPPDLPNATALSGPEEAQFQRLSQAAEKLELQLARDSEVSRQMQRDLAALGTQQGFAELAAQATSLNTELTAVQRQLAADTRAFQELSAQQAGAWHPLTIAAYGTELETLRNRIAQGTAAAEGLQTHLNTVATAAERAAPALEQVAAATETVGTQSAKSSGALENFASRMISTAAGIAAYQALNLVVQGLTAVGSALVQAPQQMETWLVTYTQLTGSAAVATDRLNATIKQSAAAVQSVQQFVALDEALLTAGITAETSAARFHRSLTQMRQDISDAAAARPDIGIERFTDLVVRVQDGSSRSMRSLLDMGITSTAELAKLGVQFNRTGTEMVSGADVNMRALLTIFEQRFGGIGAAQAQTTAGMLQNLGDYFFGAAGILGQPINNALHDELRSFLADLQQARDDGTLARWADDIDRFFNAIGSTLGAIGAILGPVIGLIGSALDVLSQLFPATIAQTQAATTATTAYSAATSDAAGALQAQADAQTTQNAALAEALTAQSKALDDTKRGWDTYYQGLQTAASAAGTALTRQAEDVRAADEAANKPLKDKIALLDRLRAAANQDREISRLRADIARDQNLAPDLYSSAGASARDRLQGEKDRLADLLAQQSDTATKQGLQAQIAANDAGRDATLAGIRDKQRANEDYQKSLQAAQQQVDATIATDKDLIQQQLDGLKTAADWWNRNSTTAGDTGTAVDGITGGINAANTAAGTFNTTLDTTKTKAGDINTQFADLQTKLNDIANPATQTADGGWTRSKTVTSFTGALGQALGATGDMSDPLNPMGWGAKAGAAVQAALMGPTGPIGSLGQPANNALNPGSAAMADALAAALTQQANDARGAALASGQTHQPPDPTIGSDRREGGVQGILSGAQARGAAAIVAAAGADARESAGQIAVAAAQHAAATVNAALVHIPGYVPVAPAPGAGTRPGVPALPPVTAAPPPPRPPTGTGTGTSPGADGSYTVRLQWPDGGLAGLLKVWVHQNRLYLAQEMGTLRPGGR